MMLTVIDYLIKKLNMLGIDNIFGLPGDFNFNILDAILKSESINWINCTNELNASYAADGYARIKGYGALVTTYGVGELSAINGFAGSYSENVPVIHIVGMPKTQFIKNKILLHHNFPDVDYFIFEKMYRKISSYACVLTEENAKFEIDKAIDAVINTKSPVYIAIPADICCMCIDDTGFDTINLNKSDENALNMAGNKILALLQNAKSPLLAIDYLIKRFHLQKDIETFINKTNIPFCTLLTGKGAIDENNKNFIGTVIDAQNYDCLITASFLNSDLNTMGFSLFQKEADIKIEKTRTTIQGEIFENVLIQDIIKFLAKNAIFLKIKKPVYKELSPKESFIENILPEIEKIFEENDIFIIDTGLLGLSGGELKLKKGMEYLSQTLWGSIGWATPASFGAQIAAKNRNVILFTGEGAHQLTIQEIANYFEYDLKPVIFVLNNGGYTIERILSKDRFDKFNDITKWDYKKIIEGLSNGKDFYFAQCKTLEDLIRTLNEIKIQKGQKLCYVEIFTDKYDFTKISKQLVLNMQNFTKNL